MLQNIKKVLQFTIIYFYLHSKTSEIKAEETSGTLWYLDLSEPTADNIACGTVDKAVWYNGNRILSGTAVNSKITYPWQLSLRRQNSFSGITYHICGGTIISKRQALTAAHCTYNAFPDMLSVAVGVLDISSDPNGEAIHQVEKLINHNEFNIYNIEAGHDISILQISDEFNYSVAVRPVCLPNFRADQVRYTKCVTTGWGMVNDEATEQAQILMEIEVNLLADNSCDDSSDFVVCAKGKMTDADPTCSGDSGGPLVCQRVFDARWELTGITSYGYGKEVEERMLWTDDIFEAPDSAQVKTEDIEAAMDDLESVLNKESKISGGTIDDLFSSWFDDYDYYAYDNYRYANDDSSAYIDYNSFFSKEQKKQASSLNLPEIVKLIKNASGGPKMRSYPCGGSTPGMFTRTQAYARFINDETQDQQSLFDSSFEPSSDVILVPGGIPSTTFKNIILNDFSKANNTNITLENLTTDLADAQKTLNIFTILQNHGCYCSSMFNQHRHWPFGGLPVDNLDRVCQLWWMCRRCTTLNGICKNKEIKPYKAKIQDSTGNILRCGLLTLSSNSTDTFTEKDLTCGKYQCECDKQLVQNIKELILLYYKGEPPEKTACHMSSKRDEQYTKCCGVSPSWVTYSDTRYECVGDGPEARLKWKKPNQRDCFSSGRE